VIYLSHDALIMGNTRDSFRGRINAIRSASKNLMAGIGVLIVTTVPFTPRHIFVLIAAITGIALTIAACLAGTRMRGAAGPAPAAKRGGYSAVVAV
jgi:hypothetical protein